MSLRAVIIQYVIMESNFYLRWKNGVYWKTAY